MYPVARVIGPRRREIPGNWRVSIGEAGPIQGNFAIDTELFKASGVYDLVLQKQNDGPEPDVLAETQLTVDMEGK